MGQVFTAVRAIETVEIPKVLDTFDAPDGTPLPSHSPEVNEYGVGWTALRGDFVINGGGPPPPPRS